MKVKFTVKLRVDKLKTKDWLNDSNQANCPYESSREYSVVKTQDIDDSPLVKAIVNCEVQGGEAVLRYDDTNDARALLTALHALTNNIAEEEYDVNRFACDRDSTILLSANAEFEFAGETYSMVVVDNTNINATTHDTYVLKRKENER